MGQFYEFDLHEAGCLTYVVLPVWGLPGVVTFLENHHIPYEVCSWWDQWGIIEDWYSFRGECGYGGYAIRSGMDPDELLTLAEGTFYIPFQEIGDAYCPVPARYAGCMPADLFEDDRRGAELDRNQYNTTAEWLWSLYDHTVLDEEGALALTRWIYEIAQIPRRFEDDLQMRPETRQRPRIDHSIYVANLNHTVCLDADDHIVEMRYYDENGDVAWVEDEQGDVIWETRPQRREYGLSMDAFYAGDTRVDDNHDGDNGDHNIPIGVFCADDTDTDDVMITD